MRVLQWSYSKQNSMQKLLTVIQEERVLMKKSALKKAG